MRKNWITYLACLTILYAFWVFFQADPQETTFSIHARVYIALFVSALLFGASVHFAQRGWSYISQTGQCLSLLILFMTGLFASKFYSVWYPWVVFILVCAVSLVAFKLSEIYQFKAVEHLSAVLFIASSIFLYIQKCPLLYVAIYVLLVNGFLSVYSLEKNKKTIRQFAFITTWALFSAFLVFITNNPANYALYLFAAYGFFLVASVDHHNHTLHLNNMVFVILASHLSGHNFEHMLVALIVVMFNLVLYSTYKFRTHAFPTYAATCAMFGMTVFLAVYDTTLLLYMLYSFIVACLFTLLTFKLDNMHSSYVAWAICAFVTTYLGFLVFDDLESKHEFFANLPYFVTWPGMSFLAFAAWGFIFSHLQNKIHGQVSHWVAACSHMSVTTTLVFYMRDFLEAYDLSVINFSFTTSLIWCVYAIILFVLGIINSSKIFITLGSFVLLTVFAKTYVYDLQQYTMSVKLIALSVLATISFCLAYLNWRWYKKHHM